MAKKFTKADPTAFDAIKDYDPGEQRRKALAREAADRARNEAIVRRKAMKARELGVAGQFDITGVVA